MSLAGSVAAAQKERRHRLEAAPAGKDLRVNRMCGTGGTQTPALGYAGRGGDAGAGLFCCRMLLYVADADALSCVSPYAACCRLLYMHEPARNVPGQLRRVIRCPQLRRASCSKTRCT
jgi:hypothetical protein